MAAAAAADATAAAGAGDGKSLGFRGYLEQPPWAQPTTTVGINTHVGPFTHAKSSAAWLYGRAGYIAIVHGRNIHGPKPDEPLISRVWTITVLSGVFDETASWTHCGQFIQAVNKDKSLPNYVDSCGEYKWLDAAVKPFIDKMCAADAKAPLWLVFDPTSFYGEDATNVCYNMLVDPDTGGNWFRGASRPMFGDAVEIRPSGKEDDVFVLDDTLFARMALRVRDAYENSAAETESKIAQIKTWVPMTPPVGYNGPVRVWTISLIRDDGNGMMSSSGKCVGHVVGRESDAVQRAMEMIPDGSKFIGKRVYSNSVEVGYHLTRIPVLLTAGPAMFEGKMMRAHVTPSAAAAGCAATTAVTLQALPMDAKRDGGAAGAEPPWDDSANETLKQMIATIARYKSK